MKVRKLPMNVRPAPILSLITRNGAKTIKSIAAAYLYAVMNKPFSMPSKPQSKFTEAAPLGLASFLLATGHIYYI